MREANYWSGMKRPHRQSAYEEQTEHAMSGTARANSLRLEWASCVWGPGRRPDNTEPYKQMGIGDEARTGIRSLMLWCYLLIPWTVLTRGVSDKMQDRVMKKHTDCGVSTGMKWGHVGIWLLWSLERFWIEIGRLKNRVDTLSWEMWSHSTSSIA